MHVKQPELSQLAHGYVQARHVEIVFEKYVSLHMHVVPDII